MGPPLPPEVTDRIIDFLWADRASLRSCALTCRAWLPVSRFHLFRTLRIWSRESFDALVHKSCIPEKAAMFRFVQHLSIRERNPSSFAHLVPHVLVNKLPNVTSIDIHDFFVWTVAPDAGFFSLLGRFSRVKMLELCTVQFSTVYEMATLLCSFTSLAHLTLQGCSMLDDWTSMPVYSPHLRSMSLTHLVIDAGTMGFRILHLFLEWLLQTPTVRTLETFRVTSGYPGNVVGVNGMLTELLHGLASSLHVVTVPLSLSLETQQTLMSASSGLRHIYFRLNADTYRMASLHLQHVVSTQIRVVHIIFEDMLMHVHPLTPTIRHQSELLPLQFRDLRPSLQLIDAVLASNLFPLLEQVIISSRQEPFPGFSSTSFRQKLQRTLHRLHSKRILLFPTEDDYRSLT